MRTHIHVAHVFMHTCVHAYMHASFHAYIHARICACTSAHETWAIHAYAHADGQTDGHRHILTYVNTHVGTYRHTRFFSHALREHTCMPCVSIRAMWICRPSERAHPRTHARRPHRDSMWRRRQLLFDVSAWGAMHALARFAMVLAG